MANNFMLKLLIVFFGGLDFFGAVAQISKKPDAASSAVQDGGYQASTLLTSVVNKVDIVPHDLDASNAQSQPAANTTDDLADMDNDEVLTDAEEEDDDDDDESLELMDANATDSGDVAMSSASKGGKRLKARLVRYHKAECEKKRHPHKGKKMKEGKCHRLDKNHFKSYEFCIGKQKKDKKGKDDDDDDESESPLGCRMMIFFDKKCKDEASSTNAEESCKDIGEEGVDDDDDDDDDKDDKKLHARDLMSKEGKGPKYKSAKFLCDGVDTSDNTTMTEDDYYVTTTVSSQPIHVIDPTGSSSKSYIPSSITATRPTKSATRLSSKSGSGEPTATTAPVDEKDPDDEDDDDDDEKEDDDKEDDDEEDEKEDDDEDKEISSTASKTTKTKKHKTKSHKSKTHTKSKKHHSKTKSISATQSTQATSDSPSP